MTNVKFIHINDNLDKKDCTPIPIYNTLYPYKNTKTKALEVLAYTCAYLDKTIDTEPTQEPVYDSYTDYVLNSNIFSNNK